MKFRHNFDPIADRNLQIAQDSFIFGQRPKKFELRCRNNGTHAANDLAPVFRAFACAPHPDKTDFTLRQTRLGRSLHFHQLLAPLFSQPIWLNDCRLTWFQLFQLILVRQINEIAISHCLFRISKQLALKDGIEDSAGKFSTRLIRPTLARHLFEVAIQPMGADRSRDE